MRITRSSKIKSRRAVPAVPSDPIRPKRQIRPAKPNPNPLAEFSTGPLQLELLNRAILKTELALDRAHATTSALQAKHERQSIERQQLKLRILRTLVLGKEAA